MAGTPTGKTHLQADDSWVELCGAEIFAEADFYTDYSRCLGVSVLIFVVMRIMPRALWSPCLAWKASLKLSDANQTRIMEELRPSDSLVVKYVRWMKDVASGSLGRSFFCGENVGEVILHQGPLSAQIGMMSVLISWMIGLPVGIISAFRPNSLNDHVARSMSILFLAIHRFWPRRLIVLALLFWFNYKAPLLVGHLLWQDP